MATGPRLSWRRKLVFISVPYFVFGGFLLTGEFLARALPSTEQWVRFVFFRELNIARWQFLNANPHWHYEDVLKPSASEGFSEPNPSRPPFDRIPHRFYVRKNQHGFREREFEPKTDGRRRLVFLGDSVTYGRGVELEERFTSLLQDWHPEVEILNLAVQGCTSECVLGIVRDFLPVLQPDVLILQATNNDVDQTLWRQNLRKPFPEVALIAASIVQRSALLMRGSFALYGSPSKIDAAFQSASEEAGRYYGEDLDEIFRLASRQDIPVYLFNVPTAFYYRYGGHVSAKCRQAFPVCQSEFRVDFPRWAGPDGRRVKGRGGEFVELTAEQFGIELNALRAVIPYWEFFYDVIHPSPLGHEFIARTLDRDFRDAGIYRSMKGSNE